MHTDKVRPTVCDYSESETQNNSIHWYLVYMYMYVAVLIVSTFRHQMQPDYLVNNHNINEGNNEKMQKMNSQPQCYD